MQKFHTLGTGVFFKLNRKHSRSIFRSENVNWRRSFSRNNNLHAKNTPLTYYLNSYVISNFVLSTIRLTRVLTTKTVDKLGLLKTKPNLPSNIGGKYPTFLKKLFFLTLVSKIFKKKKLPTTPIEFHRAFFFKKKNLISTLVDPALPTKSLNLIHKKYSVSAASTLDPKLPRVPFTSPVFKLLKSPLLSTYVSLKKKSNLITHSSFKKNLSNRLGGELAVLKFFTKYIPNNSRNFQNFSKLYSQRKLFLKNLHNNDSRTTRGQLSTPVAALNSFTSPPNPQKLLPTSNLLLKTFFLKKIPSTYSIACIVSNPLFFKMCADTNNSLYIPLQYIYARANLSLANKEFYADNTASPRSQGVPTTNQLYLTNLQPHNKFAFVMFKKIYAFFANNKIHKNIIPLYYHTLIRFIENCSGKKALLQFYPFVNQCIEKDFVVRYKI